MKQLRTRCTTVVPVLCVLAFVGWLLPAGAQDAPRPGLDTPKLRVAVADFGALGGEADAGARLAEGIRTVLAGDPGVQVIASPQVAQATASAARDILDQKPGAARALGDQLGVDVVVYGLVATDVSPVMEQPAMPPQPFAQVWVAETLTLEGQVFPSTALSLGEDAVRTVALATLELMPALGRVLSIIDSPEGQVIQLFPLGGRVLATNTEYGVYRPLPVRPADGADARAQALARQDLRPGAFVGTVRTAAEADDHAIIATPVQPGTAIAAGQLIGLAPRETAAAPRLPQVVVSAVPAGSPVLMDGKVVGVTPVAVPLAAGVPATIQVSRRDFRMAARELGPVQGEIVALSVQLEEVPPFGSLKVASIPDGAAATLDGKEVGRTPLVLEGVAAGDHQLQLTLEGYRPLEHALNIGRERTTELNLALQRDVKRVRITTIPDGARVWLDDEAVGATPLQLAEVPSGTHSVRLVLGGYAVETQQIRVKPDLAEQAFAFRLRPLAGNLRIETTPPGATVKVDGQERGKTPLALTALGVGEHRLDLGMDGFLPVSKSVEVADQQTTVVQEVMGRAEGSIVCISVPAGARISLDGQDVGATPRTLEKVPVGRRALTLSLEGYLPWSARVPVLHGQATKVEVALLRESQAGLKREP